MISRWKIYNFKSIRKETDLSLAPLTLFAGPNSSGKSTVLQSILLIAQTLAHKVGSRSVVLNGVMAKLGQFDDLRSTNSVANQIVVGWECKPTHANTALRRGQRLTAAQRVVFSPTADSLNSVSCEVSFDTNPGSPQREIYQLQPRLFGLRLESSLRGEDFIDVNSEISISHASASGFDVSEKLSRFENILVGSDIRAALGLSPEIDADSLLEIKDYWKSAQVIGCSLRHFLPSRLVLEIDPSGEIAQIVALTLMGEPPRALGMMRRRILESEAVIPMVALENLGDTLLAESPEQLQWTAPFAALFKAGEKESVTIREWLYRFRKLPRNERTHIQSILEESESLVERIIDELSQQIPSESQLRQWRLPSRLLEAVSYLDKFFSTSVKYLGPLRDEPKPLYPLATSAEPSDVGLRGELTAAVLDLNKDATIRYFPSGNFQSPAVKRQTASRTLLAAVKDWARYLGVVDDISTRDRGKLGHELKVCDARDGNDQDLTHVGVGVSQVLPILVMSLLADEDTTLIFEQPELHLHPRVQTLLGDFFLSMALLGKQCIVETHSEYLINRLRFRAATAPVEQSISDLIKIYFVEKREETSTFKEIKVNEYGAILDWPEGFFDQSQLEAEEILKAAAKKRRAERVGTHDVRSKR